MNELALIIAMDSLKSAALNVYEFLKQSSARIDDNLSAVRNPSGDMQLRADIYANEEFKRALNLPYIKALYSEEEKWEINVNKGDEANLIIAFDPLDGSSILNANFSVGSIFGFYAGSLEARHLFASCYFLYGINLEMVLAFKGRVSRFIFNSTSWEFKGFLSLENKGNLNSCGGARSGWTKEHERFINSLFDEGYRLRYSGGMVPDLHQILIKGGGLFSYPALKGAPMGKLRLFFEILPFALIYEYVGGQATNGSERLLSLNFSAKSMGAHATSPCFFGSNYEINKLKDSFPSSIQS